MKVELKPLAEVKAMLKKQLHSAADRFVRGNQVPKPENCAHAPKVGNKVQPCGTCGAKPGEICKIESQFLPRYTFRELKAMFQDLIEKREWMLRNHRDIAMLLWVLNQLEPEEEPDPPPLVEEELLPLSRMVTMESGSLRFSPELTRYCASLLAPLAPRIAETPDDQVLEGPSLGDQAGTPPG